ncbi:hypothetical protein FHG87_005144 [Trinorchestia longiramus]|nr:hypothetical protein FHG87_005144 [Trinorchestia longiramus]
MEKKESSSKAWSLAFPQSSVNDCDALDPGESTTHCMSRVESGDGGPVTDCLTSLEELDRSLPEIYMENSQVLAPVYIFFEENQETLEGDCIEVKTQDSPAVLGQVEHHGIPSSSIDQKQATLNEPTLITSTPRSHCVSSALKYKVDSDKEWSTSIDVCQRVPPDGGDSPVSKYFYGFSNSDSDDVSDPRAVFCLKADAEAIAAKLLSEKTFSSSSSDPMDKLSIIDVDKLGLDSLLTLPSSSDDDTSKSPCTQRPARLSASTENSSEKNTLQSEQNNSSSCGGNNSSVSSTSSVSKRSRIPKLVANHNAFFSPVPSTKIPVASESDIKSRNKLAKSRSLSYTHLTESCSYSNSQSASSFATPVPDTKGNTLSNGEVQCPKNKVTCSHTKNVCSKSIPSFKSAPLVRSASLSNLSNSKKTGYQHVESKVKKYIEEIKRGNSRVSSPSRSQTSIPYRTPTPVKSNTVYLVNDDLIDALDSPLPDELQFVVDKLHSASGSPILLRNLLKQLVRERECVSSLKETVAALQLNYDNLLAKHSQSQNLIDRLRLQVSTSENNLSLIDSGCASSFPFGRRHSMSFAGLSPVSNDKEISLSLSQPNLVDYTSSPLIEPNLGLSFDDSGSVFLLPTPFESNRNVPLLPSDCRNKKNTPHATQISGNNTQSHVSDLNLKYNSTSSACPNSPQIAVATHHPSRVISDPKSPDSPSPLTERPPAAQAYDEANVSLNVECQNFQCKLRDMVALLASEALTQAEIDVVWTGLTKSLAELCAHSSAGLDTSRGLSEERPRIPGRSQEQAAELCAAAHLVASKFSLPLNSSMLLSQNLMSGKISSNRINESSNSCPHAQPVIETESSRIASATNKTSHFLRPPTNGKSTPYKEDKYLLPKSSCNSHVIKTANNSTQKFPKPDSHVCSEHTKTQSPVSVQDSETELLHTDHRAESCSWSINVHTDRQRSSKDEESGMGSPFSSNISLHLIPSSSSPEPPTLADVESLPVMSDGPDPCNLSSHELNKYITQLKATDVSAIKAAIVGAESVDYSSGRSSQENHLKTEMPAQVGFSHEVWELFARDGSSCRSVPLQERTDASVDGGKKSGEHSRINDFSVSREVNLPAKESCNPLRNQENVTVDDSLRHGSPDSVPILDSVVNDDNLPQENMNFSELPVSSGQQLADSSEFICSEDQVEVCVPSDMISTDSKGMKTDKFESYDEVKNETLENVSDDVKNIRVSSEDWYDISAAVTSRSSIDDKENFSIPGNDDSIKNNTKYLLNQHASLEKQASIRNLVIEHPCDTWKEQTAPTEVVQTGHGDERSSIQVESEQFQHTPGPTTKSEILSSSSSTERRGLQDSTEGSFEPQLLGQNWCLGDDLSGKEINNVGRPSHLKTSELGEKTEEDKGIRYDVDSGCPVSDRSLRLISTDSPTPDCDPPLHGPRSAAPAASDEDCRASLRRYSDCNWGAKLRKYSPLSRSYEVFPSQNKRSRSELSLNSARDTSESDCFDAGGRKEKKDVDLVLKNLQENFDSLKKSIVSRKPKSSGYSELSGGRNRRGRTPLKVVHDNFISSGTEADTEISSSPAKRKKKIMHSHLQRSVDSHLTRQITPRLSRKFSSCAQLTEVTDSIAPVGYGARKHKRSHSLPRTSKLEHCDCVFAASGTLGSSALAVGMKNSHNVRDEHRARSWCCGGLDCGHCCSVGASPTILRSCLLLRDNTCSLCSRASQMSVHSTSKSLLQVNPCHSEPCSSFHSEPCSSFHSQDHFSSNRPLGEIKPRRESESRRERGYSRKCSDADVVGRSNYGRSQSFAGDRTEASCFTRSTTSVPCPCCSLSLKRAHDALAATTAAANSVHARSRALLRYLRSTTAPL